jgi:hypothetical protein
MRNAADRLPWIMMCAAETSDSERSGASAGQWRTAEARQARTASAGTAKCQSTSEALRSADLDFVPPLRKQPRQQPSRKLRDSWPG